MQLLVGKENHMKFLIPLFVMIVSNLAYSHTDDLFKDSNLTLISSAQSSISYMKNPDRVLGEHTVSELQKYTCGQLGELAAYAYTLQGNWLNVNESQHPKSTLILDFAVEIVNQVSDLRIESCHRGNFNIGEVLSFADRSSAKLALIQSALNSN